MVPPLNGPDSDFHYLKEKNKHYVCNISIRMALPFSKEDFLVLKKTVDPRITFDQEINF